MDLNEPEIAPEYVTDPNEPEPIVINPWHFALLSISTFGAYVLWWQFKVWKYFREKEKTDIYPALRALFFLFYGVELFEKIKWYCRYHNRVVSYYSYVIWLACIGINLLGSLPSPYFLFGILTFAPLIMVVRELNFFATGNPNGYLNDQLNQRQVLLIIVGSFFWSITIYGIIHGAGDMVPKP